MSDEVGLEIDVAQVQSPEEPADEMKQKPLQIGYTRTCNCPPSHMNCLTAKEWLKCQLGVWQFYYESRDIRDKNAHPATFPIALAQRVITLFTHQGELVLDPTGHCVVNVPDMWWENERITIHVSLIQELRRRGYELRNIIIWDRTNIVNRVGIFGWPSNYITMGVTFEYLLDFWRPPRPTPLPLNSPTVFHLLRDSRGAQPRANRFLRSEEGVQP